MSASKVVYALLSGAGGVTSIVNDRIYPVDVPLGKPMPVITYEPISARRTGAIDAYAPTHLTVARMQINPVAKDYPQLLQMLEAIKAALQFQRGVIGGVTVHSVLHDGEGPVQFDQQLGTYIQPIDFLVTHEAN
jgi:hypothetical protein